MQNYGQQQGYQRPGSTTSFVGHGGPPPPPYGGSQGYQSTTPSSNSQWAPPPPQNQGQAQWNQPQAQQQDSWGGQQQQQQPPQQQQGGYNPGVYGAMPGAYQNPSTGQPQYPNQQQDQPPPPPPKPQGFAAAVQQQQHSNQPSWSPQPQHGAQQGQQSFQSSQQDTGYPPQTHQTFDQSHGAYHGQGVQQQQYNTTAPPPPSQTPGGSYFPPTQQNQGRPGSIYGNEQLGTYSTPSSAVGQHPPNTVLSPNEQQPAYVPPSLSGQGVQAYQPTNTNPQPGVYIPPPPDVPAWQQASHAPLQGGQKKFRYTKPIVDPSLGQPQGYPGQVGMQQQGQFNQQPPQQQPQQGFQQYSQPQDQQHGQVHHQHQGSMQAGQFVQPSQPISQQFAHPEPHNQFQQPQQYGQPQGQHGQLPNQQFPQGQQWQSPPPADQGYAQPTPPNAPAPYGSNQQVQQQQWQPGHQTQASLGQQYPGHDPNIQAPKPISISGHTGTTPPGFVSDPSLASQPVSPIQNRQSMSFSSGQPSNLGRTSSVSSIAMGAMRNQQNKTSSPVPSKAASPPPPDGKPAHSALGMGGPSDWEHFGNIDEEVDDEELFGAKAKKDEPAELPSAELPSQPSPVSTAHEWPTPPSQPAPLNLQRRETFQPTPPPGKAASPAQPPSHPPQQGFVMGDAGWVPPQQTTPSQQHQAYQPPPPANNNFVMGDAGWGAQVQNQQQAPVQQPPQMAPASNEIVMGDVGGWRGTQQTPTQAQSAWAAQPPSQNHMAELKAKDEAYEKLKSDLEKEKSDLRAEIEKLKADMHDSKIHTDAEKKVLGEQIESMKADACQAKANSDLVAKEKDSTIERLNEDIEGKDDTIKERDGTIGDLKRELDAEKAKEPVKPTTADLVPDLDPWYAGSLDRYIAMLRSEATEPQVEEKIKIFQGFLRAESGVRGLEHHTAPPAVPAAAQGQAISSSFSDGPGLSRGASNASMKQKDVQVQIPQQSHNEHEPVAYSPGGRPIFQRRPTLTSQESIPSEISFSAPEPSTTPDNRRSDQSNPGPILTPTSSQDDDFNKTPIQSPPDELPPPMYKAYVPPAAASSTAPVESTTAHRQSLSFSNIPPIQPLNPTHKTGKSDEIFFGAHDEPKPAQKPASRPTTSTSTLDDVPVPPPLSFTPAPLSVTPAPLSFTPAPAATPSPRKNPLDTLIDLLPKQIAPPQPNPHLQEIRTQAEALPSDFSYIDDLTKAWERQSAQTRARLDRERRQRQEDSEARTDALFNDNEISYAEIGSIEDDFKESERDLKAQEDRLEYKSYVESVFDTVYDGLQADIKQLMELYMDVETQLHASAAGLTTLSDACTGPTTAECLVLLKDLHALLETRHERVVAAVSERDKRYKKTEIQPLYARGDIQKMKSVEKHFESAEKAAVLRAKHDRAERVGELVRVAEDVVVRAVGAEQKDIDAVGAALRGLPEHGGEEQGEVVARAGRAVEGLRGGSVGLLRVFNALEVLLNDVVLEAEIAQVRVEGGDQERIEGLEKERVEGGKRLGEELGRKVGVLEELGGEMQDLVREKGAGVVGQAVGQAGAKEGGGGEEDEKKKRLMAALEEAKRRNGHI
ncbi:hypothetical protein EJ04DRAFT_577420 [Polyplosphaeria fusca]|uniref:Uncharacterized protein n=1 Tax=Polyplosphaeria fusca TaxID=682080 RepID=A0A9P4V0Q1_9PLEO|nr:hypothetical protein EJ04DRAFT_577420 [Polyplosphaeria fusca]